MKISTMNRDDGQVRPTVGLRCAALFVVITLTGWLEAGCVHSGCGGARTQLCEEQPNGRSVALRISEEPFVCIPSQQNNNDATCAPFEAGLKARAGATAAAKCVQQHKLRCIQRECPNQCVPAGTVTNSSLFLTKNFAGCPNPPKEDACRLLSIIADCDCACLDVSG